MKERLAGSHEWVEFEGTCSMRPLMDGYGNVDDNVMNMPEGAYRGVGLRSYDAKTGQWAIWWLDSRMPHNPLDPPVKGGFENGVGTFYADDTLRGKTDSRALHVVEHHARTRRTGNRRTRPTRGKTWEINWKMDFRRAP